MRWILSLGLAAGCAASAYQLEGEAGRHRQQAKAYASVADYDRAAAETQKASELHAKAVERAVKEGRANDLTFVAP